MINFIEYPKCSTCKKAKKYLDELGIDHHDRHIEERLSKEELTALYQKSGLPLKRFFNTSGLKYKELQLKDKLPTMTEDEQLELLATYCVSAVNNCLYNFRLSVSFPSKLI